jgi:hypothetical protein
MEATPCGTINCSDFKRKRGPVLIRQFLYANIKTKMLEFKLQEALREDKQQYIKRVEQKNPNKYDVNEPISDFKSVRGWSILKNGFMERSYTEDFGGRPNLVEVYYVAPGASNEFKTHENIYEKTPIRNRTELMHLLQDSGYTKPLILDFSCGGFAKRYKLTRDQEKALRTNAQFLGVAGGNKKGVRTRRRLK